MKKVIFVMLLSTLSFLQVNAQGKYFNHHFFANVDYLASSNATNSKASKPLFAGNGTSAGIAHRWGGRYGIYSTMQFASGALNTKGLTSFGASFQSPSPIETKYTNKKWSQFKIMTGPTFMPIKKVALNVIVMGGVAINTQPNSILIRQFNGGAAGRTYYENTENKAMVAWDVKAMYPILNHMKKSSIWLSASYGSSGGSIGLLASIGKMCCITACPCAKMCPCNPPKGNK